MGKPKLRRTIQGHEWSAARIAELEAALTAARQERDDARDELDCERKIARFRSVGCECNDDDMCRFARERDQARRDAVAVVDWAYAARKAELQGVPARGLGLVTTKRLDEYRTANSSPSPSSGRDSNQVGTDAETPPGDAGGGR